MMAILRTSLSLISFGFTIYKFFEAIREKLSGGGPIRAAGPRRLGLALVSLGVFVLAAGAVQHWKFMRELSVGARQKFPFSVSLTAAVILAIIGTTAFVTILARM
jgi:putative membrane protein